VPFPNTASLKRARAAAWIVLLGCIAGLALRSASGDGLWAILMLVLAVDVVLIIVLSWWIRSRLAPALPEAPERSLIFVVIAALAWAMVDALFLGQGAISFILCLVGVLYFPLRAIQARKDEARFKLRLSKAGVCSVAGFAVLGIIVYGNVIARERAEKLVVAVEQFYAKQGRYPERLEELVPAFIPAVPRAKYVIIADRFQYSVASSRHALMYVVVPPFGRRIYTFEDRKWTDVN
jgi:hypothetical protein